MHAQLINDSTLKGECGTPHNTALVKLMSCMLLLMMLVHTPGICVLQCMICFNGWKSDPRRVVGTNTLECAELPGKLLNGSHIATTMPAPQLRPGLGGGPDASSSRYS